MVKHPNGESDRSPRLWETGGYSRFSSRRTDARRARGFPVSRDCAVVWLGWKSEVVRRIFPISKGECYIDLRRAEHSLLSLSSLPDPGTTSASSRRAGVPMGVIAPDHSMEEEGEGQMTKRNATKATTIGLNCSFCLSHYRETRGNNSTITARPIIRKVSKIRIWVVPPVCLGSR